MRLRMNRILIMVMAAGFTVHASAQSVVIGIKMYNYKKYHGAEQVLTPLAASDPKANYYLGLTLIEEGNAAKAAEVFAKFPEDPANISGTARIAYINKDIAKGNQITSGLASKSKKKEWIQEKYAADAITYTTGGDPHQAVAWYKDALTKSDDIETHLGLGDVYRKIPGGGGDAMTNYETITEKDPKNSLALSRIGDLWYEAKNWDAVIENYNKAKNTDPTNPLPYKAMSEVYSRAHQYKLALENIKKYYELSEKTLSDKIDYLRNMYFAQSNCEAAKFAQDLMNSEKLSNDQLTEVTGVLGFAQADCGDSVQALKNLRTYFRIQNPSRITTDAYIQYGKLFLKLDMLDSAGYYYTKGIAGDTARNKSDIYRTIAEAFKAKKDYPKSAEWYDNLIKSNPDTQPLDYFWRGCMLYYSKLYEQSVKAFEAFEIKYPDAAPATYWHGRALAAIDSEATTCNASPYFIKWLDKIGAAVDKKNDMKIAYEYLLLCAYNKKDKELMKAYMEKIRAIDPQDSLLKQIEEAEKPATAPRKTAPPKGGKK